jgi:pimeloyl-ACP methyl ester carboxylesterase
MHTSSTEGVELHYEVRGAGEPLLLLPGAGQSAVTLVDSGLADLFAEHFHVILMDFTGMGASGRVTEMKPEQWARDVVSVLDAVGVGRAHVGGSSLGARVAARVAADSGERVETLLVDMPITGVDEAQEVRLDTFFTGFRTNVLSTTAPRWHGESWVEAMEFFATVRRTSKFREYYTPASYLASIPAPTLICRGDADNPAHPLSMATDWHRDARSSWLWIEPGASNMALTTACPDKVVANYVRFVAATREAGHHKQS